MERAATTSAAAMATHYEFGGPLGALAVMLGLPLVILGLYFSCA